MRLIIIGPPGSGKGTHSKRLASEYNLQHISTGDLIRNKIKDDPIFSKKYSETINNGGMLNDEVTYSLMKPYLDSNFILDGYPRNVDQANNLDKEKVQIDHVLYLNVSPELCFSRILERKDNRKDDNEKSFKNRIKSYNETTAKVIDYYKKGNILIEIDASKFIQDVYFEILTKLKKLN